MATACRTKGITSSSAHCCPPAVRIPRRPNQAEGKDTFFALRLNLLSFGSVFLHCRMHGPTRLPRPRHDDLPIVAAARRTRRSRRRPRGRVRTPRAPCTGEAAATRWAWRQAIGSVPALFRRSWWRATTGFEPRASRMRPGGPMFESWIMDSRFAARRLMRRPTYALLAVLTLALGAGGTAAIFSVVRTLLIDPLPIVREDQVGVMYFDGSWTEQEILGLRGTVSRVSADGRLSAKRPDARGAGRGDAAGARHRRVVGAVRRARHRSPHLAGRSAPAKTRRARSSSSCSVIRCGRSWDPIPRSSASRCNSAG